PQLLERHVETHRAARDLAAIAGDLQQRAAQAAAHHLDLITDREPQAPAACAGRRDTAAGLGRVIGLGTVAESDVALLRGDRQRMRAPGAAQGAPARARLRPCRLLRLSEETPSLAAEVVGEALRLAELVGPLALALGAQLGGETLLLEPRRVHRDALVL